MSSKRTAQTRTAASRAGHRGRSSDATTKAPPRGSQGAAAPCSWDEEAVASSLDQAQRLCATSTEQVRHTYRLIRDGRRLDGSACMDQVREIGQALSRADGIFLAVSRLKTGADYTERHQVAVCGLMQALAREIGMPEKDVSSAGAAGLLHDIGKATLPGELLSRPGPLTGEEFSIAKEHTLAGQRVLAQADMPPEVQQAAAGHHERMTGGGYPRSQIASEIPLFARMAAICDVYDALTSARPYGPPAQPALALREMASWHGQFDRELMEAFRIAVGIYPVGSLVRLASKRLGVVVAPGNRPLAPKVRLLKTLTGLPLSPDVIDLASTERPEGIVGIEDPRAWNLGDLDDWWLAPLTAPGQAQ